VGTRARARIDATASAGTAGLRPGIHCPQLHGEPPFELRLLRPDTCHRRSGVAWDHRGNSSRARGGRIVNHSARMRSSLVHVVRLGSKWEEAGVAPRRPAALELLEPFTPPARTCVRSRRPRRCRSCSGTGRVDLRHGAYAVARAAAIVSPRPVTRIRRRS
jgi:hypothetical protein